MTLKKVLTSKLDIRLIIILIIYTLLGIFLFKYYQFQVNPDGLNYINISKLYLAGNFYNAISDYWGPLISWLLIPFLFFEKTLVAAIHATKILSLILGFFTIIGIRQLSYRFKMDEVVRTVTLFIMVPVVLYFALSIITPDLLMVCILVYFLAIIYDLNYPNKLSNGIICGTLGALAYLTKSYGFTFFIASYVILNIFQYFRFSEKLRRKNVIKNFAIGIAVFLILSGFWIGLISFKDHKITIGTSGESNYAGVGPKAQGFTIYSLGIHKPGQVNQNLIPKQWSPLSSWKNFRYQLHLIKKNTLQTITILNFFSILSLLIILAYIIMCIRPPRNLIKQNEILYPIMTIIIIAGGYVLILVEERYLWLIYVLSILMGGYLINLIFKTDLISKEKYANIRKSVVLIVFAFLFISMPVNYLAQNINTGKNIYDLSNSLVNYGVHGNVATNDQPDEMNILSYYMNTTFYGQANLNITSTELLNELKKNDINYYFVWGNSNQSSYLTSYNTITNNSQDLKVYSLK